MSGRQVTVAGNTIDIRGICEIVDKDINLSGVVKSRWIVGDVRTKLQEVAEELDVAE